MYHQITELYFKLILHEQKQLVDDKSDNIDFFVEKVRRINSYYTVLISSFGVMIKGMEREQFLQFRMALLPASGFQSAQFRMIEIYATPLENLIHISDRSALTSENSKTALKSFTSSTEGIRCDHDSTWLSRVKIHFGIFHLMCGNCVFNSSNLEPSSAGDVLTKSCRFNFGFLSIKFTIALI